MAARPAPPPPVRGTPGGWLDPWEEDEAAVVRDHLAERGRLLRERVAATRAALAAEAVASSSSERAPAPAGR